MKTIGRILIGLALFPLTPTFAELPPSAYEQKQKAAPEKMDIQVMRVEVEPGGKPEDQMVRITAIVDKVERTDTGVKNGDFITIAYTIITRPAGWVGPGPVPILNEKDKTVAYLQRVPNTGDYQPAAGAMSFQNF